MSRPSTSRQTLSILRPASPRDRGGRRCSVPSPACCSCTLVRRSTAAARWCCSRRRRTVVRAGPRHGHRDPDRDQRCCPREGPEARRSGPQSRPHRTAGHGGLPQRRHAAHRRAGHDGEGRGVAGPSGRGRRERLRAVVDEHRVQRGAGDPERTAVAAGGPAGDREPGDQAHQGAPGGAATEGTPGSGGADRARSADGSAVHAGPGHRQHQVPAQHQTRPVRQRPSSRRDAGQATAARGVDGPVHAPLRRHRRRVGRDRGHRPGAPRPTPAHARRDRRRAGEPGHRLGQEPPRSHHGGLEPAPRELPALARGRVVAPSGARPDRCRPSGRRGCRPGRGRESRPPDGGGRAVGR